MPATRHLIASQARQVYAEYWETYFKFSFVRNPWDRMVSCLRFSGYFGLTRVPTVDLAGYEERFGSPVTLEFDHRFYSREELISPRHVAGCVYGNMLDEERDFIGRFETLQEDCDTIRDAIGVSTRFAHHRNKSKRGSYQDHYDRLGADQVSRLFALDLERYGYTF